MEKIKLTISKDELSAYLTIPVKGAAYPRQQELLQALKDAGIKAGILTDKIKEILNNKEPVYELLIARGTPPVKGKDAYLIWEIPIKDMRRADDAQTREEMRIDF